MLANDPKVESELLADGGSQLVGRLLTTKDPATVADIAFTTILNRQPDAEERATVIEYLNERRDRTPQAVRQVVWSLLTGSELRFNY